MSIVRDADNAPSYLVGVMMDVDKQKRDALVLQESQARFQPLFGNLAVGIAVTILLEEANQHLQKEIGQRTRIEKELVEKAALEVVAIDRTRLTRYLHDAVTQTLFSLT